MAKYGTGRQDRLQLRDAEVVGSNPVASTTWQGQPETLILSAFPVLFLSLRRQSSESVSRHVMIPISKKILTISFNVSRIKTPCKLTIVSLIFVGPGLDNLPHPVKYLLLCFFVLD